VIDAAMKIAMHSAISDKDI